LERERDELAEATGARENRMPIARRSIPFG